MPMSLPAARRQASSSTNSPIGTISPVSSASGMNSPGATTPRSGCRQRTSASAATTSPSARRAIGWYSTANSLRVTACWSCSLSPWRRRIAVCMLRSKRAQRPLPRCLASYMATSASRISSPARVAAEWLVAMPTLAPTLTASPPAGTRWASAARIRSATTTTSSGPSRRSSSTANSSPPKRATVSVGRTQSHRRSATAISSWSPTVWPSVSLTVLKSSMSTNSTATVGSGLASASSTRSMNSVRLASPVSESW